MQIVCAKIGLRFSEYTEPRYRGIQGMKIEMTVHEEGEHFQERGDCRPLRQEQYEGESPKNVRNIPGSNIDLRDARRQMSRIVISESEALEV